MNRTRVLSTMVLLAVAGPAGAATICVNPAVATCQSTIQNGVNAAGAGDMVAIAAGTYFENVIVPVGKDGLTLSGANKLTVILDPDVPNVGDGIRIQAANVVVRNLTIRNGQSNGIRIEANGAIVQSIRVLAVRGFAGIYAAAGTTHQILLNEVRGSGAGGIVLSGGTDGSIVKGNLVTQSDTGIAAGGANVQVLANRIQVVAYGIISSGDLAVVTGNAVEQAQIFGLYIVGKDPIVQTNKTTAGAVGTYVQCTTCTGGTALSNIAVGNNLGLDVRADASGFVAQGNKVYDGGTPFSISGTGVQATLNSVSGGLPGQPCFVASGTGHLLTKNLVTHCGGNGFVASGDDIMLSFNKATFSNAFGFLVNGNAGANINNTMTGNTASSTNGQGFGVIDGATGTTVTNNVGSTKNRLDFCDTTGASTVSGNTFGVVSTTCDVVQ